MKSLSSSVFVSQPLKHLLRSLITTCIAPKATNEFYDSDTKNANIILCNQVDNALRRSWYLSLVTRVSARANELVGRTDTWATSERAVLKYFRPWLSS